MPACAGMTMRDASVGVDSLDHSLVSGNDRLASKLLAPRCPGDGPDQRVFLVAACFSATVRSLIALQTLRAVDGAGSPCPILAVRNAPRDGLDWVEFLTFAAEFLDYEVAPIAAIPLNMAGLGT